MLFVLRKHCFEFLLGVKMAPRETKTMLMQNFEMTNKDHSGVLWYFL